MGIAKGNVKPNAALSGRDLSPTEAEIALKLNEVLDQLRWFYDRGIKLEISPAEQGWSLKLTMIDTSADAHSAA